jgi:hypothetical protein
LDPKIEKNGTKIEKLEPKIEKMGQMGQKLRKWDKN